VRILLVSYYFPPLNASGAVRLGKLVSYLVKQGHDVRVLAAEGIPLPANLDSPSVKVARAKASNIAAPIDRVRTRFFGNAGNAYQSAAPGMGTRCIANLYRALFAIPDAQIGWYPAALRAVRELMRGWAPDVIVASAPPFTAHIVAARLARESGRPWIAEFRDLYAGNPYGDMPSWRVWIDRWIENAVLKSAAACVTVSQPLADELAARHGKPVRVVMNGFDAGAASDALPRVRSRELRIVYTGIIYPGRRDPVPLFQAIALLGEAAKRVRVDFYGQDMRGVRAAAQSAGIEDCVGVHGSVSHELSLRYQREADILLLVLWDDIREVGVYTGKLFEYAGSRRPILAVGCGAGVAAALVRERRLGIAATDPAEIAAALKNWIGQIDRDGQVEAPPTDAVVGLSAAEQFQIYETLMQEVVRAASRNR
jgi:glycosyltransferase involved in cell wall biosynthesis